MRGFVRLKMELAEAQKQFDENQADFDEKDAGLSDSESPKRRGKPRRTGMRNLMCARTYAISTCRRAATSFAAA